MLHLKTSQNAVAVVSRLAELYPAAEAYAASGEIAEARNLPQPLVAKILNVLARARLVKGSPGPGGGYRLARPPAQVTLFDVAVLFESLDDSACPYGPDWCGNGDPCPLHEAMVAMRQTNIDFLRNTSFQVFAQTKRRGHAPKRAGARPRRVVKRGRGSF